MADAVIDVKPKKPANPPEPPPVLTVTDQAKAEAVAADPLEAPKKVDPTSKVVLGDIVFWYDGGDANGPPTPAIVTAKGFSSLAMNVFSVDSGVARVKESVRHVSDTGVREDDRIENGVWDFRPRR